MNLRIESALNAYLTVYFHLTQAIIFDNESKY